MLPRWTELLATLLIVFVAGTTLHAGITTNNIPPTQVTLPLAPVVFSSGSGNLISVSYADMSAIISLELAGGSGGILLQSVTGLARQYGNNGTGFMNFKGTVTAINAALSHLTYYPPGNGDSGFIIISTYDSTNTLDQDFITVLVNNPPVLAAGEALPSVDEGTVNPAGETITTLLQTEFFDANNHSFVGIAIVADASDSGTQGDWEYSTDAGGTWFDVGSVSTATGLLLDVSTKLRFVPLGGFTGAPGALTVHAVDNSVATTFTSDATRSLFNTTADAESSPVAVEGVSVSTSISIVGANDAPLGRSKTVATNESTAYTFSATDFGFSDVDVGDTLSAVRIDSLPLAGSLNLSGNLVTAAQAIATGDIANLVFTPAAHANGARYASFTFSVRDQSSVYDPVPNTLTVTVTPVYAAITSVSVPANGTYVGGAALEFTVNFSEAITVTGTPALRLSLGMFGSVNAGYVSGSGTAALIFRYTVASHILDTDGFAIPTLNTNGGTLTDVFGDNATLTINNAGSTAGVLVNGGLPGVSSVAVPSSATYVVGSNLDFTVNFSETITVDTAGGTPRITLTLGASDTVFATYLSGSGTSALIFRYTVADGNLDLNGIAVGALDANGGTLKDAAANNATLTLNNVGSTTAVLIEAVAPRIGSIERQSPASSPTNADTIVFRVGFSEAVANVDAADFSVSGTTAAVTNVASSASDVYDITVSGGDLASLDGTVTLSFAGGQNIADLAGNALTNLTPTGTNARTYVIANNIAPTFNDGATQTLTINEDGSAASLADLLEVVDAATGQTLTWSVTSAPAKGTLGGFPITAGTAGTATPIAPAGLTYTPSANQNGSDSFTIQVSDGIATDSITVNVTIVAVSDAPVLADTVLTLANLAEGTAPPAGPVGQLVSALTGSVSDADGDAPGIAVTGVNANGSLWYSTNNGTLWTRLTGTVSGSSALMLYADATTRISFEPIANYSGTASDAITFRAWDRTGGVANGQSGVDLTANTLAEVAVIETGGSARSVAVAGNYAYVADESTGLVVFDISDPDQPAKLSVLAVGGMAQGVAVSGSHVYVANGLGLVVVDVSNASAPVIVGTYIGTGTFGRVAVSGNFAYVAKAGWQQGLAVIDISNPTNPLLRGTRAVASVVYHVAVSGNYAYLADEQTGMVIMNISNPDNPTVVSTVDTSGYPHAVAISGTYAYVADSSGGLATIDITGPGYAIADTQATPGFAYGVAISEGRAFVADQTVGLVLIDISNPLALSPAGEYAAPGAGNDVAVSGSHIYLAMRISGDEMADPPTDATGALAVIRSSSLAGSLSSQSATAEIEITAVNDAPAGANKTVATNEDTAFVFAAADFGFTDQNDSPASNFLSLKIATLPGAGTLRNNGVAVNAGDFVTKVQLDAAQLRFTPTGNGAGAGYASFTFQVRDDGGVASGGVDLDASANTLTIDVAAVNDAPTEISLSPSSVNQSVGVNAAVGTFSTTDVDDSSFTYALVTGADSTHNGLFNLSGAGLRANDSAVMAAGTYSIRVSSTDASSATFSKSLTVTVVDNVVPASPSTPDLATASDTGSATSDNLTNDTTPTFTGTAEASSTVGLFRSGSISLGTASADGSGAWSITVGAALAAGTHSITAKATDAAGNTGAASSALSIVIDPTAPSVPSTPNLVNASDTGTSDTDDVTNDTTPSFTGTAEVNSTVELFQDVTTSLGTTSVDGSGAWSLTVGTGLTSGTFSVTAIATDSAGTGSAASNALSITIDTTAPATPVISAISEDLGTSATDFITSDTTLIFSGTAEADSLVAVLRNAVEIGTATAGATGTWSFDFTGSALAEGSHTFTATTADLAGNISGGSPALLVEIVVATITAPVISAISNDSGASSTDGVTNDATLILTGTATANQTVAVARNGVGEIGTATANGAGAWSFDYTASTLPDGVYLFTAIASDTAGNASAVSADFPVTIDATAPVVGTQPVGGTFVAGGSFSLSVAATDASALTYQWSLGAAAVANDSTRTGATTSTITHTNIGVVGFAGNYTVAVTDLAGNTTTSTVAAVIVEQADQTITFPAITDQLTTSAPFAISATASTGFAVTFAVVSGPATVSGSTVTVTGVGSVTIRATQAGDVNYQTATADRTFTVTSPAAVTSAPVITQQPAGQSVTAGAAATFSVAATGTPSPTFQWRRGGVVLSGQTGTSLTVSDVAASDSGAMFDVVVSNSAGSVTSSSASLTVSAVSVTDQSFFGSIGADGRFALYVHSNGEAVMMGELPAGGASFLVLFALDANGAFQATTSAATSTAGATANSIDPNRSVRPAAAATISGSVVNGQLSFQLAGTGDVLGGAAQAGGTTSAFAGFYEAPVVNGGQGTTYLIVGPNGTVMLATVNGSTTEVAQGSVSASGQFSVPISGSTVLDGFFHGDGGLTGQVTTNGVVTASIAGVSDDVTHTDRLINISTRGATGDNDKLIIAGFVISGPAPKSVLIRAIGPGLTGLGVTGAMADPVLTLFRGNQVIFANDDWGSSADPALLAAEATRLGATALAVGGKDAALLVTLDPGVYTAHITRANSTPNGVALIELYDASVDAGTETPELVNISSRGEVRTGEGILISGFVVTGNFPKQVLIRGVGPTLANQGLSGVLENPMLRIWKGSTEIASNDDWSTNNAVAIDAAALQVGAFPLTHSSKDAAVLLTLAPGIYTAQVSGLNGTTGIALVEVYDVP